MNERTIESLLGKVNFLTDKGAEERVWSRLDVASPLAGVEDQRFRLLDDSELELAAAAGEGFPPLNNGHPL